MSVIRFAGLGTNAFSLYTWLTWLVLTSAGCSQQVPQTSIRSSLAKLDDKTVATDSEQQGVVRSKTTGKSNFNVSVASGGKPITNFNQPLVHRVTITKVDFKTITSSIGSTGSLRIPFTGKPERDQAGQVAGVRISEVRASEVLPTLGLQDGDLITAVGKKHPSTISDLVFLASDIKTDKSASITVVRRGTPHKILYTLN